MDLRHHPVLAIVSNGYSEPKGRFPRVTHPCATRPRRISFDLHVLGMPPAFVLSPDQTLKFMSPSSASGITSVRKPHLKDPLCTFLQDTIKVETPTAPHYVWIREGHIERDSFKRSYNALKTPQTASRRPHVPSSVQQCQRADKNTGTAPLPLFLGAVSAPGLL